MTEESDRGAFGPPRRNTTTLEHDRAWVARVTAAIRVLDEAQKAQKGSSVIMVPASAVVTVQVAAAYAVDHVNELH